MTTVKQIVKKLYKECDHSAEVVVRVKDDVVHILDVPLNLPEIKEEVDEKGRHRVIIDLT
jgi:hypothetical protein